MDRRIKMIIKFINTFLLLIIAFIQLSFAQINLERPNKAYGIFSAKVTISENARYLFEYQITNADSSEQVLSGFDLLIEDQSFYDENIDIPSPATKKWYIDGSNKGYVSGAAASRFINFPPENGLAPGESISISFPSRGLPAIMPFYTQGFVRPITMTEFDSLKEAGFTDNEIFLDWKEESHQGITIAPKVWPDEINLINFLDTLINYQTQSCELGWISNPGICRSLQANLDNVKRQLEQGRTQTAINNVQAFLNELEAIREQQLSPEAYALLKFNGEYLLEQLQQ